MTKTLTLAPASPVEVVLCEVCGVGEHERVERWGARDLCSPCTVEAQRSSPSSSLAV
jgi:hypothetical protein